MELSCVCVLVVGIVVWYMRHECALLAFVLSLLALLAAVVESAVLRFAFGVVSSDTCCLAGYRIFTCGDIFDGSVSTRKDWNIQPGSSCRPTPCVMGLALLSVWVSLFTGGYIFGVLSPYARWVPAWA